MVCKGFYLNKVGLRGIKHLGVAPRPFRSFGRTGHWAAEPVLLPEDPGLAMALRGLTLDRTGRHGGDTRLWSAPVAEAPFVKALP